MTVEVTRAFILAAGLGERARPLSLVRPKPLFPLLDRTLIGHVFDRLADAGVREFVINSHHLAESLTGHLTGLARDRCVAVVRERDLLGTGGGLWNVAPYLGRDPFFLINSDIHFHLDLASVAAAHRAEQPYATLVLHDCPEFNQVAVGPDGLVAGFRGRLRMGVKKEDVRTLAFTGIHVVEPDLFGHIPPGPGDVITIYQSLVEAGLPVRAHVVDRLPWWDAGNMKSYLRLHGDLLSGAGPGPVYVDEGANVAPDAEFRGFAAVYEGARVESGAVVEDSVLWPGALVKAGARVTGCVLADGAEVSDERADEAVLPAGEAAE